MEAMSVREACEGKKKRGYEFLGLGFPKKT